MLTQRIDEYEDQGEATTNTSSYNSQEAVRAGGGGGGAVPGTSGEYRGSDELRRRSFNQTPEHNADPMHRPPGGGTHRQHAKSYDNYSGKHMNPHSAESSPSSGGGGHYLEGVASGTAAAGSAGSTGSAAAALFGTVSVSGRPSSGRVSSAAVPIAIAGATATAAAAHGVMRHPSGYVSSSASSHSTPPFSLMERVSFVGSFM